MFLDVKQALNTEVDQPRDITLHLSSKTDQQSWS